MIRVKPWKPYDLGCSVRYGKTTDFMRGVTVWDGPKPLACGGVMDCEWGRELWIEAQPVLNARERIIVGRIARKFVEAEKLNQDGGRIYAHVFAEDDHAPRLLEWFGMRRDSTFDSWYGEPLDRYLMEE